MYITDIVYLLDVLVVIVYMSYCNCWDYLLLHEDWGECSEDWGSETHAKKIRGGLGCLGRPTPPPGGRAGSENDTFLPMTMTCDRLKFWSGPAWRSKVIIRKPWRRKKKKIKIYFCDKETSTAATKEIL